MSYEKIEEWLDSPAHVPGWLGRRGDWRFWLKDIMATFFDMADDFSGKLPNCDSGWWSVVAVSLCIVDPMVADSLKYKEMLQIRQDDPEDWETIEDLEMEVYDSLDPDRAEAAFNEVLDYLFARRN